MTNDEIIKELAQKYESVINQRDDSDYQINQKNWTKLISVLDYISTAAAEFGGRLEPINLVPKEQHGYIEAVFDVFDVYGESLKAFIHALNLVDVFSVEPLESGQIRIGININNVYEKK